MHLHRVYTVRRYGEPGIDAVYSSLELAQNGRIGWTEEERFDGMRQWFASWSSLVIEEFVVDPESEDR